MRRGERRIVRGGRASHTPVHRLPAYGHIRASMKALLFLLTGFVLDAPALVQQVAQGGHVAVGGAVGGTIGSTVG